MTSSEHTKYQQKVNTKCNTSTLHVFKHTSLKAELIKEINHK